MAWVKKDNSDFDVGMDGPDSAEVCELVGLFLLNQMEIIPQELLSLYRDDGLGTTDLPSPALERLRKEIIRVFQRKAKR